MGSIKMGNKTDNYLFYNTASDHDSSEFVRNEMMMRIFELLKNNNSIKLIGIPKIGITSIMKRLFCYCSKGGEWSDLFFGFYICRYDEKSFKSQINNQLESAGFNTLSESITINEIFLESAKIARNTFSENSEKKIVFILDDFQKNLEDDQKNKNTILTIPLVTNIIRDIAEAKKHIVFIVSYTYPIDFILPTDWYLANFSTEPVDLLTKDEMIKLVNIRRKNHGLETDEDVFDKIDYYGGRHPLILNRVTITDFKNNQDLTSWLTHKYVAIVKYIKKKDPSIMNKMCEIAKKPVEKKPDNEFLSQFCYEEENNGKIKYKLFSKHFSEYIANHECCKDKGHITSTNLIKYLLAGIISICCSFTLFIQAWEWLQNHEKKLCIYILIITIYLSISWAILDKKRLYYIPIPIIIAAVIALLSVI